MSSKTIRDQSLDFDNFVDALKKTLTSNKYICNIRGKPYYGKVLICIHEGRISHVETSETHKID